MILALTVTTLAVGVAGIAGLGALAFGLTPRHCRRCARNAAPWKRAVWQVERCADGTSVKARADGRTWHEDADGYVITYEDES
jgi:hypothetical protein